MANKLLTPQEAAERLGITRAALYAAIREGRLKGTVVLNHVGVKESDLEAFNPRPYRDQRRKPAEDKPKNPVGRPKKVTPAPVEGAAE